MAERGRFMVCNNCGKDIPEGNDYCLECGAPLDEPVVIKVTKDDIRKVNKKDKETKTVKVAEDADKETQGAFINIAGYLKSLTNNIGNMLALIGAVLLYLSPFMTWLWEKLWDTRSSGNLFDLGSKNGEMALGKPIITVFAIMVLLTGLAMLALSARENIRPLKPYADNYLVRFIPVLAGVIIFVLIIRNGNYVNAVENIDRGIEYAKQFGVSQNYKGGSGIGPALYIGGLVLYAASVFMDMIGRKKKNV